MLRQTNRILFEVYGNPWSGDEGAAWSLGFIRKDAYTFLPPLWLMIVPGWMVNLESILPDSFPSVSIASGGALGVERLLEPILQTKLGLLLPINVLLSEDFWKKKVKPKHFHSFEPFQHKLWESLPESWHSYSTYQSYIWVWQHTSWNHQTRSARPCPRTEGRVLPGLYCWPCSQRIGEHRVVQRNSSDRTCPHRKSWTRSAGQTQFSKMWSTSPASLNGEVGGCLPSKFERFSKES